MQGLRSQKKRSLHEVNEHFFDERNAAGGHYGQTLNKFKHQSRNNIPGRLSMGRIIRESNPASVPVTALAPACPRQYGPFNRDLCAASLPAAV
jgi:hypothetical protein